MKHLQLGLPLLALFFILQSAYPLSLPPSDSLIPTDDQNNLTISPDPTSPTNLAFSIRRCVTNDPTWSPSSELAPSCEIALRTYIQEPISPDQTPESSHKTCLRDHYLLYIPATYLTAQKSPTPQKRI